MEPSDPNAQTAPAPGVAPEAGAPGADRPMFDKPNLQLRDPDPYAFANRIRRLLILGSVLACLAVAPFLARVLAYNTRLGEMRAEVEIAREALGDLAPQLVAFEQASRLVAKKAGPSVVKVISRGSRAGQAGEGSGFVADAEGFVITNEHVVRFAELLQVQLANGQLVDASLVGRDPLTDLAVLKIEAEGLTAIDWADSDALQVGDLVWAVGSPFGLENSITFGIVSATARRTSSGLNNSPYQEFFQSDAAVNPGNSGGPMVNLAGQVVGVNTAIYGDTYQGVSFSIPSNFARETYQQLRETGYIERGFLGIRPDVPPEVVRRRLGLELGEGVFVEKRDPNTPAEYADLRRGDVILRWNNHKAIDPTLLSREIANTPVGSKVTMLVRRLERDGEVVERELQVEVGRHPNTDRR